MHDETNDATLPPEPEHSESMVMLMLLHMGHPWPWSMQEIGQELSNEILAADAVAGLHAAGLVSRFGEFVFPTRAATHMHSLSEPSSK